jgi:hypothetical protein
MGKRPYNVKTATAEQEYSLPPVIRLPGFINDNLKTI